MNGEKLAIGAFALVATTINGLIGGFDLPLEGLLILMVLDFITGILVGIKSQTLSSQKMFWGGMNKILVLGFVVFGVVLDNLALTTTPYFRLAILWFYIAREGLSIVENYGLLDMPLPDIVVKALEQLAEKANEQKEE